MKRKSIIWFRIRIGLLLFSGSGGVLAFPDADDPIIAGAPGGLLLVVFVALLIGLVATPVMVALVIAFQAINPFSDPVWDRPCHYSNPFRLRNPLPFFHFFSFFLMVGGTGMVVGAVVGGVDQLLQGIVVALFGGGCLGGVHLAMRLRQSRMEPVDRNLRTSEET